MAGNLILIDVSGSLTWVGEALSTPTVRQSSTVWRISRIDDATSGAQVIYADNDASFTKKWSERTTYVYTVN